MAIEGTVKINGLLYNISSKVIGAYHSRLPGKVNTGQDSFDKEQFLSNWIISDGRGGILVDEMDESIHSDRNWWTNNITDYDGHMTLPRLAVAITVPTGIAALTLVNGDMELEATGWTNGARSTTHPQTGTYDWRVDNETSFQALTTFSNDYRLMTIKVSCHCWSDTGAQAKIAVTDGVDTTSSSFHTGSSGDETLTVTHVINAAATKIEVQMIAGVPVGYFDNYIITEEPSISDAKIFVNFNGELYIASGSVLVKLASGRITTTNIRSLDAVITDMFIGPNGNLLIYLGDSTNYYYMTSGEVFQQTNVNDANIGLLWDSKAWKLDTDGNWWYSTDGDNSATPTWTSRAGITDIPSEIERLIVGRDGDGNPVIYCSTNTWLKLYDFTNNKWINTEVKLYGNQHHGKGFIYWNSAHYLSYGIGVKQYTVGNTGTLSDTGLNRDGGLPTEYNGIITRLIDGGDQLFALVDSSLISGNSQSTLNAYTGRAWRCWWAGPNEVIEDCEDAWNELVDGDVTSTLDNTDFMFGSGSAKLVVATGAGASDILATEAISSTDISGYDTASLWIKSTVALSSGDLQLLLDDTANCASPIETIDIPAISADIWTRVDCTLAAASSDTAIISIGIKMVVDKGAFTLNIDQVEAVGYNDAMSDAIVSSAESGYAVYFNSGTRVYYIDIPEGLSNPKYLTGTQTYNPSGLHLSPWFDGDNQAFQKLSKAVVSYAKLITTTEIINIKYRVDKTFTDRDSGWTLLDTLNAAGDNGEVVNEIASGAGLGFNSWQYRLDFVRGGTTTLSPDMLALTLGYRLVTQGNWSWTLSLLIDKSHNTSAKDKWENLESAIESQIDIAFIFRFNPDETHFIQFLQPREILVSGKKYDGEITIQLLESWLPT